MRIELVRDIDAGDEIAFIEDLQFDYDGIFSIDSTNEATIDWVHVNSAQISGSIVHLQVTHSATMWDTEYNCADHLRVIVYEE